VALDPGGKRRNARATRLVAQKSIDAVSHEPLLPSPDGRLGGVGSAHDLLGAVAIGGQQHDLGSPHMLLPAVPIRHDRRKTLTIGGTHL
jgi:hypothetical protein